MSIGFIMLRHVNSEETGKYWKVCYSRIRKYYPEVQILLIDDNRWASIAFETSFESSEDHTFVVIILFTGIQFE